MKPLRLKPEQCIQIKFHSLWQEKFIYKMAKAH